MVGSLHSFEKWSRNGASHSIVRPRFNPGRRLYPMNKSHQEKSATELAYQRIRERILRGALAQGEHLKERQLAAECGVSRTPIRDALRRLASERLVEFAPNRGVFVARWSEDDQQSLFDIGALLEGYAAYRAASRCGETDVQILLDCCAAIDEAVNAQPSLDLDLFVSANARFHEHIRSMANSQHLSSTLERLIEQRVLFIAAVAYDREELQRSNQDHRQIVFALRSGDGELARALMQAHVLSAFHALRREN